MLRGPLWGKLYAGGDALRWGASAAGNALGFDACACSNHDGEAHTLHEPEGVSRALSAHGTPSAPQDDFNLFRSGLHYFCL